MLLKQDCRHFPGDRPCQPHKEQGITCDMCTQYESVGFRIIIIKLDAVGDVLRTTCILHGLKEQHPRSEITWVTLGASVSLFDQNELVDRVLTADSHDTIVHLTVEKYDLLMNLDAAPRSAALASFCRAALKLGYGLDASGKIVCFNPEAERWLAMGAFDPIKKQNTRSYQDLMLEICRLRPSRRDIMLRLSDGERAEAVSFRKAHDLPSFRLVVGMNTGASPRWEMKKWTLEGYRALIGTILTETDYSVVLYGGQPERERNLDLARGRGGRVIMAETQHSLRSFFALLSISDIVITGDTLALHAATALGKRVIAIFGPTSATEIETYGLVRKVISETMECRCFYKPHCDEEVHCMNTIPAERIWKILREEAALLGTFGGGS